MLIMPLLYYCICMYVCMYVCLYVLSVHIRILTCVHTHFMHINVHTIHGDAHLRTYVSDRGLMLSSM